MTGSARLLEKVSVALLSLATLVCPVAASPAAVCMSTPHVDAAHCPFFVQFDRQPARPVDARLGDTLGVSQTDETRSIALIVAVDNYPHLAESEQNLSAAAVDRQLLVDYLLQNQKFDEVIVLANADATLENIEYFLDGYLKTRGDDFNAADMLSRARLLIAFTGHGRPDSEPQARDAAFILAGATDLATTTNVYRMSTLAERVQQLSRHYFHVLTLVNACFGGNTFNAQAGGNPNDEATRGSYVITAGNAKDTVPSLDPSRGSLFFDTALTGLKKGDIDPGYISTTVADQQGSISTRQDALIRTKALFDYIDDAVVRRNVAGRRTPHYESVPRPWLGPDQFGGPAMGAFFFLTSRPIQSAQIAPLTAAPSGAFAHVLSDSPPVEGISLADGLRIPTGPISSVHGHPELKIFKSPNIYPKRGYDLSSEEARINWTQVARAKPSFIYARALAWKRPDKSFTDRWTHAAAMGADRGAYLKFNFCLDAEKQREAFRSIVPVDDGALPPAIQLVEPQATDDAAQAKCYQKSGKAAAQDQMLRLARLLHQDFGKVPLFFGNVYNLNLFLDVRFAEFMVWLAKYGSNGNAGLKLQGTNPWTLWQYSSSVTVPGIGNNVAENVFFGTGDQYALFKAGSNNAARAAVE